MDADQKSGISEFLEGRVTVVVGDITKQDVEAIVNAANSSLLGGGGVDGAIHRAGGPEILAECREIRRTRFPQGLPTGEAVITTGGKLAALYVIHAVGPIYGEEHGKEAELLANCYHNSLTLAVEKNLTSLAFPAISTGVYGYPPEKAAAVASSTIENFLSTDRQLKEVRLVFFQARDAEVFLQNQKFTE
ncbi:MAG: O-acetyl-ADP-ribose deacetylase [Blastocatellia bacterium]|jgi:O-acetyl-ADP-ribose deacetylase (regulator of RNase III)|nr:O-acetyl-ADP-ribose deacetylase [Blastocatellia bacterium]